MANQGYPDEGADRRVVSGFGWLQAGLILHRPPPNDIEQCWIRGWLVTFQFWPPFIMAEKPIKVLPNGEVQYRQVRLGWTWRRLQHYFIPGAAFKTETGLEPDYGNAPDKD